MRIDRFDFELPDDRIALRPAQPRDSARLLVVAPDGLKDGHIPDLLKELRPGDVLVFNNTKVIPARMVGRRGEARVEVTVHREKAEDCWLAFAKPARKCREGDRLVFGHGLSAEVTGKGQGGEIELRFDRAGEALMSAFRQAGVMPLPPYIAGKRKPDERDLVDYQTVFAESEGAVAAPTAGLHFTERLLERIDAMGVKRVFVTLHVGAGTFLPVKAADTRDHKMHAEWGALNAAAAATIKKARADGGRIVAIGTTSLRLLESAARGNGEIEPFQGTTDLFIEPGYRFRAADLLWTNFHLPRSTLFILVCAFSGTARMKRAYRHAVAAGYRFYSYGDACLLYPSPEREA